MTPSDPPPSLPEVVDEAGDTPRWVPALGVGLFVLFAALFVTRSVMHPTAPPTAAAVTQEQPAN